ncbi:patatin-like phospholipase family protein [Saccharopolyspora gloriosae]|uniref:patatin-like phospholipase family protein n=1 Tax=Saccharopolyspora gloriosae TaxID=455344 RepID=UPI001FB76A03|nr:patatin-like phospholipase family protein [Saccharopolyspora gloriosae]
MRTAWVMPGGSTFGAIQAGLATALFEADVKPDLLVGTSAGSLNAAWLAREPSKRGASKLRELWRSMRRSDIFPLQPTRFLAGKLGITNHLMASSGLARWVHRTLPYRTFEQAEVPLTVTATDVDTGDAVYFDRGPLLPPLVASCSIPGLFPPLKVNERWLVDGGAAAFMPISRAVELGAERVFVLPCGGDRPFTWQPRKRGVGAVATLPVPRTPPRSVSGVNGAALGASMLAAARLDLQLNSTRCDLYVLPAPSTAGLSPYSFSHSAALIDAAWNLTRAWFPHARPIPAGPVDSSGNPEQSQPSLTCG